MISKLSTAELIKTTKKYAANERIDIISADYRDKAIDLLIDSFMNDPFPEYVTGIKETSEPEKDNCKKLMMKLLFNWMNIDAINQKEGICMGLKENDQLIGVVTIKASECDQVEGMFTILRKMIKMRTDVYKIHKKKNHFHPFAFKRIDQLVEAVHRRLKIMKDLGHEKYIYIQQIGVKPDRQGEGNGGKLLRTIFDIAVSTDSVCYLETETEENVSLYKYLGFKIVDEIKISVLDDDDEITFYCMLRA